MRTRTLATLALLIVLPLALLGPALLPGQRLLPHLPVALEPLASEFPDAARASAADTNFSTSDRIFPALSDQIAIRHALTEGALPTWEPHLGLGFPLFAGSMVGALHPLHWPAAFLPPDRVAGFQALLALFLAGLGIWLFLGALGLPAPARLVGALALQGGGWGIANVEYFMKLDAALSLPWQLWAIEGLRRDKRWAPAALACATAASFLAGFPSIAVFCVGATGLYALARMPRQRPAPFLGHAALFAVAGVSMAAIQLWPMAEASAESIRRDADAASTQASALPALSSLGVALPDAFGAPTDPPQQDAVAWWITPQERWDVAFHANPLEWNTYVGVVAVLLALVALVVRPRAAALPVALLIVVYGFAQAWPVVRFAYHLPGFGLGSPGRVLAVAWVLWPWLAALGVSALIDCERRAWGTLVGAAAAFALAAGALYLTLDPETWPQELEAQLAQRYERSQAEVREILAPEAVRADAERLRSSAVLLGVFALAAAAAVWGSRRLAVQRRSWAFAPLLLVLGAEATLSGRAHVAGRPTSGLAVFPNSTEIDHIAGVVGDGRLLRVDPHLPAGRDVLALARPSLLQPYRISDLATWIIFTPSRLAEWMRELHPGSIHGRQIAGLPDAELLGHPLLDLLRVTAVLAREPLEHERLELVRAAPAHYLYARSGSVPAARVVRRAEAVDSAEAARLRSIDVAWTLLETTGPLGDSGETDPIATDAAAWSPGKVRVARPAPNRFDANVTKSGGGWLVMQEQFFPGWHCTVDGEPAELLCADGTFRAVRVPPGDSVVRTWYAPRSLVGGAWLSLISLLFVLVGRPLFDWVRHRQRRTAPLGGA